MSKHEHRRFTVEQKREILREADQPGVTVSEVCRHHGLAPSVFYRWRPTAQDGSAVALANKNARIVWALSAHDREFQSDYRPVVAAAYSRGPFEVKRSAEGQSTDCTGNHDVMARQVRP